jgi:hypothetical protein
MWFIRCLGGKKLFFLEFKKMALLHKSILYINSANRISGTDGQFSISLPVNNYLHEFDRVAVLAANIPKTFYQVQAGFNTFTLIEGASNITVTVPAGTYSRSSFATAMSALLTASSANSFTYAVSIPNTTASPETGKFTFSVTGNGATQPAFRFSSQNIYEQFGFPANSTSSFVGNTLVSSNVCNMSSENCLFIHSDICYNPVSGDNILQELYTGGIVYNSFINFSNQNVEYYAKPIYKKSTVYEFALTDEASNPINLNGINMLITLVLFKTSRTNNMLEDFIRYKVNKNE